jgi:hypothetical protein
MRGKGWLAAAVVIALLAACGTVHGGRPADAPVTGVAAATRETLQQRAVGDAADLLASFIPPPHAVRTTRSPVSLLAKSPTEPASADVVTWIGWWQTTGQPASVLRWIRAHQRSGFSDAGFGGSGRIVPPVNAPSPISPLPNLQLTYVDFTRPDVPGVLVDRTMIAAVVNALPSQPPVAWTECGPTAGPGMQLTFRATADGPALAVVIAHQELCPVVSLTIGGRQMPELDGASTLFQRVMAIAGFHWTDFPAPGPTAPGPISTSP